MLKRRYIHAVLLVLLACLGVAQAQQAAPAQPKPRRFLMWKAASPTATVYLVGSIHLGDSSMYPLPKEVESAFAAAAAGAPRQLPARPQLPVHWAC